MGLDVAWGSFKTDGALIQMAVDTDVSEFPVLEAGFMIVEMVTGKGSIIVAVSPPNFSVGDGDFFFFSQRR